MRKDVKAGLALSLVFVVLAGWYYMSGEESSTAIPLEGDQDKVAAVPSPSAEHQAKPATGPRHIRSPERVADAGRSSTPERSASRRHRSNAPQTVTGTAAEHRARARSTHEPRSGTRPNALLLADRQAGEEGPPAPAEGQPDPSAAADAKATETSGAQRSASETPPAGQRPGRHRTDRAPSRTPPRRSPIARTPEAPSASTARQAVEMYTVQRGDTFAILAEIFYGSQRYADFLMKANPEITDPRSLSPGTQIRIPELPDDAGPSDVTRPAAAADDADVAGTALYTVREGDSFYSIAKRRLGSGARWPEIYELNKDVVGGDPKGLRAGQTIRIPVERQDNASSRP